MTTRWDGPETMRPLIRVKPAEQAAARMRRYVWRRRWLAAVHLVDRTTRVPPRRRL